jgi:hypothetical protein
MATNELAKKIFDLSEKVRYVAIYDGGELSLNEREGIANTSSSESDKYEELIVNPTILKIATQRGEIDCGGLEYVVIKYGSFFLLTIPRPSGHVSVGMENDADPLAIEARVRDLLG